MTKGFGGSDEMEENDNTQAPYNALERIKELERDKAELFATMGRLFYTLIDTGGFDGLNKKIIRAMGDAKELITKHTEGSDV